MYTCTYIIQVHKIVLLMNAYKDRTIYECIKIVNMNTKTNYHKCVILSNIYASSGEFPWCSSDEVSPRRNGRGRSVPATKWLVTKCTRDEMAGDELSTRRNGCRRSVRLTKRRRRNVLLRTAHGLSFEFPD